MLWKLYIPNGAIDVHCLDLRKPVPFAEFKNAPQEPMMVFFKKKYLMTPVKTG